MLYFKLSICYPKYAELQINRLLIKIEYKFLKYTLKNIYKIDSRTLYTHYLLI